MNKPEKNICAIDIFAGTNVLMFLWMCRNVYFDRFVYFRGHQYLGEFFVYALVILAVIAGAWKILRRHQVPAWMLVLVQVGVVLHFSGGLAIWDESRLYDKIIFHIRYDKYVHFINSFICCLILYSLYFRQLPLQKWIRDLQLIIVVLGLGAVVEIVEYLVTLTVTINGVGGYDNNMQDMIANLLGSVFCIAMIRITSAVSFTEPQKELS